MFEELAHLLTPGSLTNLPFEQRELLGLHLVSDGLLALAYLVIPLGLFFIALRRRDLEYRWLVTLFGGFILLLAGVHALELGSLWESRAWVLGSAKAGAAALSVAAAVALWVLMPRFLSLPSPGQLRRANASLTRHNWEREQHLSALVDTSKRLEALLSQAPLPIALVSASGRWLRVNQALCEFLGRSEEELLATDLQSLTHPDDLKIDLQLMRETLEKKRRHYQLDKRWLRDGQKTVLSRVHAAVLWGEDGKTHGFVYQLQDLGPWYEQEEQLQQLRDQRDAAVLAQAELDTRLTEERDKREAAEQLLAQHAGQLEQTHHYLDAIDHQLEQQQEDPLTGLPGARQFLALGEKAVAMARRYQSPLTLLRITPEPHSDAALAAVGEWVRQQGRESDIAGRWHDSIVLLLPHLQEDAAQSLAIRLRRDLKQRGVLRKSARVEARLTVIPWDGESRLGPFLGAAVGASATSGGSAGEGPTEPA